MQEYAAPMIVKQERAGKKMADRQEKHQLRIPNFSELQQA
jgi:hypothetical protein